MSPSTAPVDAYYESVVGQMQQAVAERDVARLRALIGAHDDGRAPAWARARMRDFRENVDRVRAWYDEIDGNIINGNFATGTDGMTFSLWRSDDALRTGAYGPGLHRAQLDRQKAERLADRTSYTRTRLLRHTGTWDGRDPLTEVA